MLISNNELFTILRKYKFRKRLQRMVIYTYIIYINIKNKNKYI